MLARTRTEWNVTDRDVDPVFGCGCPLVLSVLRAIGARHAAAMHEAGLSARRPWTAEDWRQHFLEEDEKLVPRLRAVGVSSRTIGFLRMDHQIFLHELERYGRVVSVERLRRHAALEEDLVKRHHARLVRVRVAA